MDVMKCSACNSTSIDLEHGNWICFDCGLIVKDVEQFQSNADQEGLTYTNNSFFDGQRGLPNSVKHSIHRKSIAPACKNALERTKRLGEYFKFTNTMMQNLVDIFQSLLKSSIFIKRYTKNKAILGGVVAFIVSNRAELMIPMDRICERVECSLHEFKSILNMVLEANPSLKPDPRPINDLIPFIINDSRFDSSELKAIKEHSNGLVELIRNADLMDGKHPTYVIHAALCFAWKSIKPKERGHKITFKRFCSLCKLPFSETGNQRYKELLDFFSSLVTYLPWINLSEKEIKSNISFHLVDILNHPTSLIHRYKETNRPSVPVPIQETSNLMKNYKPVDFTSDEPEISDKEIESYLRSKKEIKFIKDLQGEMSD